EAGAQQFGGNRRVRIRVSVLGEGQAAAHVLVVRPQRERRTEGEGVRVWGAAVVGEGPRNRGPADDIVAGELVADEVGPCRSQHRHQAEQGARHRQRATAATTTHDFTSVSVHGAGSVQPRTGVGAAYGTGECNPLPEGCPGHPGAWRSGQRLRGPLLRWGVPADGGGGAVLRRGSDNPRARGGGGPPPGPRPPR